MNPSADPRFISAAFQHIAAVLPACTPIHLLKPNRPQPSCQCRQRWGRTLHALPSSTCIFSFPHGFIPAGSHWQRPSPLRSRPGCWQAVSTALPHTACTLRTGSCLVPGPGFHVRRADKPGTACLPLLPCMGSGSRDGDKAGEGG